MSTKTRITIDEFLALPETEPPSELIDGEVVQKVSPNLKHSVLALELGALLRDHVRPRRAGIVGVEGRHIARVVGRVYLPDVHVTLAGKMPAEAWRGGPIDVAPDLAIEILSPDDKASLTLDRIDFYFRVGVRLVWIVDPERETVGAYRAGGAGAIHRPPEIIDASPVLPEFRLDLAALFAVMGPEE